MAYPFPRLDIGEVWANILFNVYAALLAEHGFDASAPTNPASTAGNAVWLHLLIDALKLQPCNPTRASFRSSKIICLLILACSGLRS